MNVLFCSGGLFLKRTNRILIQKRSVFVRVSTQLEKKTYSGDIFDCLEINRTVDPSREIYFYTVQVVDEEPLKVTLFYNVADFLPLQTDEVLHTDINNNSRVPIFICIQKPIQMIRQYVDPIHAFQKQIPRFSIL